MSSIISSFNNDWIVDDDDGYLLTFVLWSAFLYFTVTALLLLEILQISAMFCIAVSNLINLLFCTFSFVSQLSQKEISVTHSWLTGSLLLTWKTRMCLVKFLFTRSMLTEPCLPSVSMRMCRRICVIFRLLTWIWLGRNCLLSNLLVIRIFCGWSHKKLNCTWWFISSRHSVDWAGWKLNRGSPILDHWV